MGSWLKHIFYGIEAGIISCARDLLLLCALAVSRGGSRQGITLSSTRCVTRINLLREWH